MATKGYLIINVAKEFSQDRCQEVVTELEAMPEVESVDLVSGIYDLVVKVEVPIRLNLVANKIMAKEWVKRLCVLKVEPFPTNGIQTPSLSSF